mgnify:FL=1|tara:strand:- start:391 stop:1143 length:753 start_codon:yes stop_codon:yes gene_type:complete
MPDTISMDETQADAPELNADEQESLALGEQMQAAEDQLLAGKYKSVEELEKGYLEAQKALSNQSEPEVQEEPVEEPSDTQTFLNSASAEYAENGELSQDTMSKLTEMSSEDLVNAYIASQVNQAGSKGPDLNESQVRSIKDSVGGEAKYETLVEWAGQNLDAASVQAFDALIETGNAKAIELAVAGLNARYESENGSEGQMITGKPPATSGDRFRSQAEVVEAMSDPRYDRDPAYRQEITEKIERSDNFF